MAKTTVVLLSVLLVFIYIGGCAGTDKELADAEAALQAAKDAGAQQYAPTEYQAAEDLINRAKQLMAAGQTQEARELLEQARYKAIEAKGKAMIAKSEGAMTEEERMAKEQELQRLKEGGLGGMEIGLQDIFFDYDRADIRPDARSVLRENAQIIQNNPGVLVVVEGYCDIRGTEEYNLALGQRRADTTKAYLVGLGASYSKLEAVSKGETEQWAPGTSEEAYQENRRAHFVPTSLPPQASR
ncbi:MAG TPA: OmpA family protein [Thermodesulfobacteriota bacterium]